MQAFLQRAGRLFLPGLIFGVSSTIVGSRIVGSMVYGISAVSPLVLVSATAAMLVVAFAAMAVPVFRAMSVDPVNALRTE